MCLARTARRHLGTHRRRVVHISHVGHQRRPVDLCCRWQTQCAGHLYVRMDTLRPNHLFNLFDLMALENAPGPLVHLRRRRTLTAWDPCMCWKGRRPHLTGLRRTWHVVRLCPGYHPFWVWTNMAGGVSPGTDGKSIVPDLGASQA